MKEIGLIRMKRKKLAGLNNMLAQNPLTTQQGRCEKYSKTLFKPNPVHLNPLPDPTKDEAVLKKVVSGDHQDGAAIEGRAKDGQPFLQEHASTLMIQHIKNYLEVEVKEGKG